MRCKSLWIKASAKCINVNVNCRGRMCSTCVVHVQWTELPSLKWRRENKMATERSWERRARISTESKHTPRYVIDWLGTRMLFCMLTHSPSDEAIWLSSVSRDWAKISQSSRKLRMRIPLALRGGKCCIHAFWISAWGQSQPERENRVLVRCALKGKPQKASVMRCYLNVKVRIL